MSASLFDALGFCYHRAALPAAPAPLSLERVCFRFYKQLPEFVWDAAVLEGNPFTFPEVKTLLDGITVGGRKLTDQEQVLNLAHSTRRLLALVKSGQFALNKTTFTELNALVARNEALEWGIFRGEGQEQHYSPQVALGEHGRYSPLPTQAAAPELNRVFAQGIAALQPCPPLERALAFFLFGALQQFFFDGNKRTSRLMMNGILLVHGMDALSIPAAAAQAFNEKMVQFYLTKNADDMMQFLLTCHPAFQATDNASTA